MAHSWSRIGALDVLDACSIADKTWTFYWPGRVVVEPVTDGIEWHPRGETQPVPLGTVLVAPAFAGHLHVRAREGARFRVVFDRVEGAEPSFYGRVYYPQVCAWPSHRGSPTTLMQFARDVLDRAAPVSTRVSTNLLRARELLAQNLAEEADLVALAAAVGVDRCHLCRSFQKGFGLPPYRFRAHVRIARARLLLASGRDCTDVAYELGFCDQSHLTRSFKELTGTTPGAYARRPESSNFDGVVRRAPRLAC